MSTNPLTLDLDRKEIELKKRELGIQRMMLELESREERLRQEKVKFQSIIDQTKQDRGQIDSIRRIINSQVYMSLPGMVWESTFGEFGGGGGGGDEEGPTQTIIINQNDHDQSSPQPNNTTPTTDPNNQDVLDTKINWMKKWGRELRGIAKQLVIQHDDHVRNYALLTSQYESNMMALNRKQLLWDLERGRVVEEYQRMKMEVEGLRREREGWCWQNNCVKIKVKIDPKNGIKTTDNTDPMPKPLTTTLSTPNGRGVMGVQDGGVDFDDFGGGIDFAIGYDDLQTRFTTIQQFSLPPPQGRAILAMTPTQFQTHHHNLIRTNIINVCNQNSKSYGGSDDKVRIEFRSDQIDKSFHYTTLHYRNLLNFLYHDDSYTHINPHNNARSAACHSIFMVDWKKDLDQGKIPPLTPNLKLYFSTPNLLGGNWIQFHGPGTLLWIVDPTFQLMVGSLCDPNGKGKYLSVNCQDPSSKRHGKVSTSDYQIKIKWE